MERVGHLSNFVAIGAEHCENWFDAILHRKKAIISFSSDDSPEDLHVNEESKRQVTEKVYNKLLPHRNRPQQVVNAFFRIAGKTR
jgi:hypothetical protein